MNKIEKRTINHVALSLAQLVSPAFFGGLSLSLVAGPLGAFLVWHRLSYVADAFAHAAILGLVVSAGLNLPQGVSMASFALFSGAVMWVFLSHFKAMEDTLLVLFSVALCRSGLCSWPFLTSLEIKLLATLRAI